MKLTLTLTNRGQMLSRQAREVVDAASFAAACADIWADLEQRALEQATSVGAFMEHVNEAVADQLDGAVLSFERK